MTSPSYHIVLTDIERAVIEQQAHNFHTTYGQPLRIPPRLFDDLKVGGVDTQYMIPDPSLET